MEFSEKYELVESLTTGAVESFVAKTKARGERVLVHILQGEPQRPNQPTVQWVLEAFRKVAPEPVGVVLETGRYSGTAYAYIVTTLPDDTALRAWVGRYNAQNQVTQGLVTREVETQDVEAPTTKHFASKNSASEVPSSEPAVKPVPHVPVQFTQIFRELDSQANRPAPIAPVAETNEAPGEPLLSADLPRQKPNFEERFPSAVHAAPKWDELARTPPEAKEQPGLVTSAPLPEFGAKNVPPDSGTSAVHSAKPGEFTNFWQGPFRVDGPPEVPASSLSPLNAQKKPGEFTLMFQRGAVTPESPVFTPTVPEQDPSRSGMTNWATHSEIMGQMAKEAAPVAPPSANEPTPIVAPSAKESPALRPPAVLSPQPVIPPAMPLSPAFPVPVPVPPKPVAIPVMPPAASTDGATSAFGSAASEPVVAPAQVPEGPGAYTRIISTKQTPAEDVAPAEELAAPKLPSFAAPSKPAMPAMAAPPLPKIPPTPKVAPPQAKAPKAPKLDAPKLDASKLDAAKPPVSYWPIVLTLTVLFFIAVLLVLYFVLKH
jgi:hypothetical protein